MGDRYRDLIERFLEQVATDPAFRQQLRENPQQALESSGFAQALNELRPDAWQPAEVLGYSRCNETCFNYWTCLSDSCYITI